MGHESFHSVNICHVAVNKRRRPIEIVSSQTVNDRLDWPEGSFVEDQVAGEDVDCKMEQG